MLWIAVGAGLLAGCGGGRWSLENEGDYVKPTIAVLKFENRAPFPLNWDLGGGMQDILVDNLVQTRRYQVIERAELAHVMREIKFQQSGATRRQSKAELGQLKNVQYLVKGTITDFGHVSRGDGFLGLGNLEVFGGGDRAIMGMTLYVIEVESGQIIASESLEETVRAQNTTIRGQYDKVGFGSSGFYRTPLGRATAKVIRRAVDRVTDSIAARPWEPKVALVREDGSVVINGGKDRNVQMGQEFEIYEKGEPIINPDTGDILGREPGVTLGRIRVNHVRPMYSVAHRVMGDPKAFAIGQPCREVAERPVERVSSRVPESDGR